jgi:uncharacterized protein YyaL (SSP411 family)
MKLKFRKSYLSQRNKALVSYTKGIFMFAEKWADEMEKKIVKGKKIKNIADKVASKIDKEMGGVTGYMYNCSVLLLSMFWRYGDALRRWHNIKVQYGDEGIKANKTKRVLNSAVINLC